MADIDIENVDKLKVAELRALLSSHDLDTKGTKPILVTRLKSYLESLPAGGGESSPVKADAEAEDEPMEEEAPAKVATPAKPSPKKEVTKEEPTKAEDASKEATTEEVAETPKAEGDATKTPVKEEEKRGKKRRREDEPFVVNEDEPEIPDNYM